MSATLYTINILDVSPEKQCIRMLVSVSYFDGYMSMKLPHGEELDFFLRVLCDPCGDFRSEHPILREETTFDIVFDPAWGLKNAHRYIKRVERLWITNNDRAGYSRCYAAINKGVDIASEDYVEAEYNVYVTDPAYLSHLSPQTGWGSGVWNAEKRAMVLEMDPSHRAVLPDLTAATARIDFSQSNVWHPIYFIEGGASMLVGTYSSHEMLTFETATWQHTRTHEVPIFPDYLAVDVNQERYWGKPGLYIRSNSFRCWSFDGEEQDKITLPTFEPYASALFFDEDDDDDEPGHYECTPTPSLHRFHLSPSGRYFVMVEYEGASTNDEHDDYILVYTTRGEHVWHEHIPVSDGYRVAFSSDETLLVFRCNDYMSVHGDDFDDRVLIYELETGQLRHSVQIALSDILFMSLDPTNTYLAVLEHNELLIYHIPTNKQVFRYVTAEAGEEDAMCSLWWVPGKDEVILSRRGGSEGGVIEVFPLCAPA